MSYDQYTDRKQGRIARRKRDPQGLSDLQRLLAIDLADRYQISEEHAGIWLDYYFSLMKGWMSPEQFLEETQIEPPVKYLVGV